MAAADEDYIMEIVSYLPWSERRWAALTRMRALLKTMQIAQLTWKIVNDAEALTQDLSAVEARLKELEEALTNMQRLGC